MRYRHNIVRKLFYIWIKTDRIIKRKGPLFLFNRLYKKIKMLTFRTTCSIWFEKSLDEPVEFVSPGIDITTDFLVSDKSRLIEWLTKHYITFPWIYISKEIDAAKSDNHIFVTLLHQEKIIGYIKVGIQHVYIHDFDRVVSFPPASAFIYDTFILPDYRGKHLALYGIAKTIDYLREGKFKKLWCHIEKWNQASLRTFHGAGFKEKGCIRFSRLFGLPFFIKDGYKPLVSLKAFIN